ncbi:hypothetical protein TTHERM_001292219 (macronuclear) [Tetrahymena thermophila SB210]|uniref:Kinase domain protein n=1 Tax=Tetrahymena thermophila (strain SB210) TaxID=312017 RepID=W7XFV8_TETTS|nr:hypothetical protein TTHERM_001292219 [Tetrahymena thermophila SB210]EWS76757.1 hypothetical protein TTHERM_001292219 [Tetrahymena thermophila SB210]|eukprot:XP_012650705.1 hypothetical protein TTHERM_001292219 [Tetrahymena thermophila SB210]
MMSQICQLQYQQSKYYLSEVCYLKVNNIIRFHYNIIYYLKNKKVFVLSINFMGKNQSKKIEEREQSFCGLLDLNVKQMNQDMEVLTTLNEFFTKSQEYIYLQNLSNFTKQMAFACYSYKKMKVVAILFKQFFQESQVDNEKSKIQNEQICNSMDEKAQFLASFNSKESPFSVGYDLFEVDLDVILKQYKMEDLYIQDSSSIKNMFIDINERKKYQGNCFDLKSFSKKVDLFQLSMNNGNNQSGIIVLSNLNQFLLQQQNIISFTFKQQGSNFASSSIKQLLNIITNNNYLKCLDLELKYSQIDSSTLVQLCGAIQKCKHLLVLKLDLALNNLCKSGLSKSFKYFGMYTELQILSLSFRSNRILSEGMQQLAQNLEKLLYLRSLNINFSECGINNGIDKIGYYLQNCKQISHLQLSFRYNNLRSEDCVTLMKYINNIQSIVNLSLDYQDCQLNSKDLIDFVMLVKNQKQLTELDLNLRQNNIGCETAQIIINELSQQKYLKSLSLDIQQNRIQNTTLEKIRRMIKFSSLIKMSFGIKQKDCHSNVLNKFYSAIRKNIRLVNFHVIN